jgi:hypothetical protein
MGKPKKYKPGLVFGLFTIIDYIGPYQVNAKCVCGKISTLSARRFETYAACGCSQNPITIKKKERHGGAGSATYKSWLAMRGRCYRPGNNRYYAYGARGIVVCSEWKDSFKNFLRDMGERPDGMTLDRIDSSGNYEPSNCKWSTIAEQNKNRRAGALWNRK